MCTERHSGHRTQVGHGDVTGRPPRINQPQSDSGCPWLGIVFRVGNRRHPSESLRTISRAGYADRGSVADVQSELRTHRRTHRDARDRTPVGEVRHRCRAPRLSNVPSTRSSRDDHTVGSESAVGSGDACLPRSHRRSDAKGHHIDACRTGRQGSKHVGGHTAHAPIGALLLRYLDGVDGCSDDKTAPRPAALKPASRNVPRKRARLCLVDAAGVSESVRHAPSGRTSSTEPSSLVVSAVPLALDSADFFIQRFHGIFHSPPGPFHGSIMSPPVLM